MGRKTALPAGRLASLGATRDFRHGLLVPFASAVFVLVVLVVLIVLEEVRR